MNSELSASRKKRLKVSSSCSHSEVPSASISDLPNDLLKYCFSFIPGSYITVGPVSRQFFSNYSTLGIHESASFNSAETLLLIGQNRRTTVDAVSNDVNLTEWSFISNAPKEFLIKVCRSAAIKGQIDVLECAHIFGIQFKEMIWGAWCGALGEDVFLMKKFANEGNLEMIQYFDSKLSKCFDEPMWTRLFHYAAKYNHLYIMKWICQEKGKRDKRYMERKIEACEHDLEGITSRVMTKLCKEAVTCGNIQVLEYCHQNNYQFGSELCICAVESKGKEQALVTLKWLRQRGCPWNKDVCRAAALNDNLEVLKWARSEDCPWDERTLGAAAERGNIGVIEYCLQNQCPLTAKVCTSAMENKDHDRALEVLKLLRKYSCPWDLATFYHAINNGHFEAMLWAKRNGFPWTDDQSATIVEKGDASIIEEYLKDEQHQESPMMQTRRGTENALQDAAMRSNRFFPAALSNDSSSDSLIIEKLKLLRKYGYEWDAQTTTQAAKQGRLLVLQWLRYMKCNMDEGSCTGAVESGNIDILKYVHEAAGCGLSKEAYACCFAEHGLDKPRSYIPRTVRGSHRELLIYLQKNDCPKPKDSDWKFASSFAARFSASNNRYNFG